MYDIQSIIALSIVVITVMIFAYKIFKRSGKSCGGGCSCSMKPKTNPKVNPKAPSFNKPDSSDN